MKTGGWLVLIVGGYLAYSLWWKGATALAKTLTAEPAPGNGGGPVTTNGRSNGAVANGRPTGAGANGQSRVVVANGRALDVRAPGGAPSGLMRALAPTTAARGGCPDCRCRECP